MKEAKLFFIDDNDKEVYITVPYVKDDLTEEFIQTAMKKLIDLKVSNKNLSKVLKVLIINKIEKILI